MFIVVGLVWSAIRSWSGCYDGDIVMAPSRLFLRIALGIGLFVGGFGSTSAHAATWGSFDATRIAYATGALTGDVHSELRNEVEANGDEVGAPTGTLTAEYLAGVDVFYTGMLSDGTGPSAGNLGTLSPDEQAALDGWIVAGGTLVITVDSNGFDGPFDTVYDSWLGAYGVTAFSFNFDNGAGMPNGTPHPITDGVGNYIIDNPTSFSYGADGLLIGTGLAGDQPMLVVFEPETGFADGGRILVVADHNALTDNFINDGSYDNDILAQNIVAWAGEGAVTGPECGDAVVDDGEECDDGNTEDGDGCSATCMNEAEGDTSGGVDGTGGSDDGPVDTSSGADTDAGSGDGPGDGTATEASGTDGDGGLSDEGDDTGCGCRGGSPAGAPTWLLLGLGSLLARRRRRGDVG